MKRAENFIAEGSTEFTAFELRELRARDTPFKPFSTLSGNAGAQS
jgi:hypothetical protein